MFEVYTCVSLRWRFGYTWVAQMREELDVAGVLTITRFFAVHCTLFCFQTMMFFPVTCLKKGLPRGPVKICMLHLATQVPVYSLGPSLSFHSYRPHLSVWLEAVKSWAEWRDEKRKDGSTVI